MERVDVVIIGGGPAGSTVGSLLKKYFPYLHVKILERAVFPRHHVGESLLAGATPVLRELEVQDKIENAGFPEKLGASYVWGRNNEPWGFEFQELNGQLERAGIRLSAHYFKGWQVRRAEYDDILLKHAREWGVDVVEGARVVEARVGEQAGRGVTYERDGRSDGVAAELVVDCSGQHGFLARRVAGRTYDSQLNNIAIYGYWKGARWKYEYAGFPNVTRILIASTPTGWIWYIPVAADTISVGFVTHSAFAKQIGDLRQQYFHEVRSSPEVAHLLSSATLTRLSADQPADLLTERDWSYTCERFTGEGWVLAGDAAGFVDPILSSGVMLAHQNGQKAAYTINSVLRGADSARAARYWDFYDATYKQMLSAYRQMARFWYANNFTRDSWWWEAWRQLAQANEGNGLASRDSFMRLASGYANRTESISLFGSYTLSEAAVLADYLFQKPDAVPRDSPAGRQWRLQSHADITTGFLFHGGFIHDTPRIVNRNSGDALNLFSDEMETIHRLRAGCTLDDLESADAKSRYRRPAQLLVQLEDVGVLSAG